MNAIAADLNLDRLLAGHALRTFFQPIVSVRRKMVLGVESLLRAVDPDTGKLISPKQLFEAAVAQDRVRQLDRAARNHSLRTFAARGLADQCLLFLNIDLDSILHDNALGEMIDLIRGLDIPPGSIVTEIVEHQFDDSSRLEGFVARVREHGMLVAVDDIGAGHSNLERIGLIAPDILKIDRSLCAKLGSHDQCTEEVFSALVNLGRRIGALVVAEGIETCQQAMGALERGAELLQGYLVLPPHPGDALDLNQAAAATQALAGHYRQHMLQSINRNRLERRRLRIIIDSILCDLSQAEPHRFASVLARSLLNHPQAECAYVLDLRGQQVTDTIFSDAAPPPSLLFRPADAGTDHSLKTYYHSLLDSETNRYTTERYISLASGRPCRTISSSFRDTSNDRTFILCVDVMAA